MPASTFWVKGGLFASTEFRKLAEGESLKRFGPFGSYEEAEAEWHRRAWAQVDEAYARFWIEEEQGETGDVPEGLAWFVVGGVYRNTDFTELVGEEVCLGPFTDYKEAEKHWKERAWQSVDDCHARFRIEQRRTRGH